MTDEEKRASGWAEWAQYVLKTLEKQSDEIRQQSKELGDLKTSIEIMKMKWSIVSIAVSAAIAVAVSVVAKVL